MDNNLTMSQDVFVGVFFLFILYICYSEKVLVASPLSYDERLN